MVSLPLLLDQSWTTCYSASDLTSIDSIYIVLRFSLLVPLFFLVLGIWDIRFWRLGWDSGIFSQLCLRIWDGFRSCEFFFFLGILSLMLFVGTDYVFLILFINLVCFSLAAWVYIYLLLCWRIYSLMTCKCLALHPVFTEMGICFPRTWGSTGKEVERSSFWIEGRVLLLLFGMFSCWHLILLLFGLLSVPRIWQRFKLSFIICFAAIAMMIIFTTNAVPFEWQIPGWNWALIIPLSLVVGCHILLPVSPIIVLFLVKERTINGFLSFILDFCIDCS